MAPGVDLQNLGLTDDELNELMYMSNSDWDDLFDDLSDEELALLFEGGIPETFWDDNASTYYSYTIYYDDYDSDSGSGGAIAGGVVAFCFAFGIGHYCHRKKMREQQLQDEINQVKSDAASK